MKIQITPTREVLFEKYDISKANRYLLLNKISNSEIFTAAHASEDIRTIYFVEDKEFLLSYESLSHRVSINRIVCNTEIITTELKNEILLLVSNVFKKHFKPNIEDCFKITTFSKFSEFENKMFKLE